MKCRTFMRLVAIVETHTDRTLGKWDNLVQAAHVFPTEIRGRVHIKGFGGPRDDAEFPEGNPQSHGAMNDGRYWEKEFWEVKQPPNDRGN